MVNALDYQILEKNSELGAFYELYAHTMRELANWSETTVLSAQEYLHLHEKDIGAGPHDYRMWTYLKAFVESLSPALREKLASVIFCFSFENFPQPSVSIETCLRQEFYWYRLKNPAKERLQPRDLSHTSANVMERPAPSIIKDDLPGLLKPCAWIQPYMLQKNSSLDVLQTIQPGKAAVVRRLIARHEQHGSYQFSIYGYELKERATLSPQEVLLLNMAFLIHVWTWNHDLRAAHGLRRLVQEQFEKIDTDVRKALDNIRAFGHSLKGFRSVLIPADKQLYEKNHDGSMFKKPHTILDWDVAQTATYFRDFTKIVADQQRFVRLSRFVQLCGWKLPVTQVTEASKARARATWLSTRYLTRRALASNNAGRCSPDQIALAVLLGLDWEEADYLPVRIEKRIEDVLADATEDQLMETLCLTKQGRRDLDWPGVNRTIKRDKANATFKVSWSSVHETPETGMLRQFMDSGMLSFSNDDTRLEMLRIPKPRDTNSEFLRPLHDLTLSLSAQRRRKDETLAQLKEVVIETSKSSKGSQTQVRFQMDAVLPQRLGAAGEGEISQPLGELGLFFGAERATRFEGGRALDAGVYLLSENGLSAIVIILQDNQDAETAS
ncbi:MAG TPA: hypothetical protein VEJ63_17080 [Planctomycetota bacterium]|nr:hypothetical protein [Planctomycetota bacterium]